MATYIHERPDWPQFRWNEREIATRLARLRHRQGRLAGRMEALSLPSRAEAALRTLTEDVVGSSAIEGEILDEQRVRFSIARRLGLDIGASAASDRHVEGVVEMMLDATLRFAAPLTAERLFAWHASLFPTGLSGMTRITVGAWRNDEKRRMQVVSGAVGRERVHFQAPPASRLDGEMRAFLQWFEGESGLDPVLKAALAHLWFVTLHPFDDGNGRIGRAIVDLALARSEASAERFYSLSAQMLRERKAYYDALERTEMGDLDVTARLAWFLDALDRAIDGAETTLASVLAKARFWEAHAGAAFNERQRAMLARLLDGFVGKLTTSKWAKICKCSQDTALRDIDDLVQRSVLIRSASGGRSASYALAAP